MAGSEDSTVISIKGLRLEGAKAPNIWGDIKEQPAHVNVSLDLWTGFDSAASADKLDDSTIHYGELAKSIRAATMAVEAPLEAAFDAARQRAYKQRTNQVIAKSISVELVFTKASACGGALSIRDSVAYGNPYGFVQPKKPWLREFAYRGLRIMTLIGVNEYERRAKQLLIIDCKLSTADDEAASRGRPSLKDMTEYFQLERSIIGTIEETAFETLESLADHTVQRIRLWLAQRTLSADLLYLRFEKPAAIAFADAPIIEVTRRLR